MNEARRLYRSETERMLGGVCGGLGEYFGVDPTVVRLAFVAATLVAGFGPVIYLIMWIVVPRRSRLDAPANETAREAVDELREQAQRGVAEARSAYERWRAGSSGAAPPPTDGSGEATRGAAPGPGGGPTASTGEAPPTPADGPAEPADGPSAPGDPGEDSTAERP